MGLEVAGGVVLDSSRCLVCVVQTSQINSNFYSLVFVCLWLGLSLERKQRETRCDYADVAGQRKLVGY